MKTVLITGGSRGIGRAMVELFCEKGYLVAFTYKNSAEAAKELFEKTGAFPIFADAEQKRTFAYIWNTDTATFDLYYTSTGKTYKLVAAECNPTDESIFEEVFGELGNLGSNNNTENDNNNENTNNENTNEE